MPVERGVVDGTNREEPLAVGILHPASSAVVAEESLLFANETR